MSPLKIFYVSNEIMCDQKNVHVGSTPARVVWKKQFTSASHALSSANALAKIDNLAPIQPRVDTADSPFFFSCDVRIGCFWAIARGIWAPRGGSQELVRQAVTW